MKKKDYLSPELEIEKFRVPAVITASDDEYEGPPGDEIDF